MSGPGSLSNIFIPKNITTEVRQQREKLKLKDGIEIKKLRYWD
jgi:hypothetical protein